MQLLTIDNDPKTSKGRKFGYLTGVQYLAPEKLASEQGPGMGAAMLAAYGCGWYPSLKDCAQEFIQTSKTYYPIKENVEVYKNLFKIYQQVYTQTKELNDQLREYRK